MQDLLIVVHELAAITITIVCTPAHHPWALNQTFANFKY